MHYMNALKKCKYLLIILIIINIIGVAFVLSKPFPFISMDYATTDFDERNVNSNVELTDKFQEVVKNAIAISDKENISEVTRKIAEFVRTELYHDSALNLDIRGVVFEIAEIPQLCSGYSRLVVSVANTLGYDARVVWMKGHTISEIYFPEKGWVLVDTNGNLVFKNEEDEYLSLTQVTDDFSNAVPTRLSEPTDNDPDYLGNKETRVYDNNPIVVVIDGENLFDFGYRTRNLMTVTNYVLFGNPVARGVQYISNDRTRLGNARWVLLPIFILDILLLLYLIIMTRRKD
ncbi:transglutaminase domain-containing protein [Candidatus Woesearchaeota archaeon]|nr:transglutaminase domain-containing protein [Candidatus Woesearchaeota archaeon]